MPTEPKKCFVMHHGNACAYISKNIRKEAKRMIEKEDGDGVYREIFTSFKAAKNELLRRLHEKLSDVQWDIDIVEELTERTVDGE